MANFNDGNWIGVAYLVAKDEVGLMEIASRNDIEEQSNTRVKINQGFIFTLIDRLSAWYLSGTSGHCELILPRPDKHIDQVLAYTVFSDKGVTKSNRDFKRQEYKFIYLNVTAFQVKMAREFCDKQLGKPFDKIGMALSLIWPKTENTDSYWCVKFVTTVLKHIQVLRFYNPCMIETEELIYILSHLPGVVHKSTGYQFKTKVTSRVNDLFDKKIMQDITRSIKGPKPNFNPNTKYHETA